MSDVRAPIAAGFLCFILATAMIAFTAWGGGVSCIWPANAVLVVMLLLRPRERWWPVLAAGFVAEVFATFVIRGFSPLPLFLSGANMVEVVIAARATDFIRDRDGIQGTAASMIRFALAAGVLAPAASATIGAATFWAMGNEPYFWSWLLWFAGDSLGLLIFTPFFFALFSGQYARCWTEKTREQRLEAVLLFLLTLIVAVGVFEADRPLLYLVIMPTMLVAFRVGWIGVKVTTMMIAMVGAIATTAGQGPIVRMTDDPMMRAYYLQIFLVAQMLTQWPVVAALTARDRLVKELQNSERSLRILAAQSSVLLLTFDVGGICRRVVGTPDLLPGRDVDRLPGLLIDDLSDDGTLALRHAHERAMDIPDQIQIVEFAVGAGQGQGQGQRRDGGGGRWLEASFRALDDEGGRCPGTLMTLHDISVRKEQTIALALSAQTDSLTGLLNRAGFLARLDRAVAAAPVGALSLALIDVDRFKLINDNCGHQTGDAVLGEIARRIAGLVRSSDCVGRLGGDEFVLLLTPASPQDARDACARLVEGVARDPVSDPSGQKLNVAISCGLAPWQPGLTADDLLHRADIALYEAKRGGRNRMVAA